MSDVLLNNPPPAVGANRSPVADVAEWLGSLLDAACDREDAALSRLIAGVMDDLSKAARGELSKAAPMLPEEAVLIA